MRKRIVSLVLILCMCIPLISVMPVSADYTLSVNDDVLWGVGKTVEEIKAKYGNDFYTVYNRNEETGEEDILTFIYSTSKLVGAGIEVGSNIIYNTHNNMCFEAMITLNAIILEGAKDYYNMDTLSLDTLEKLFGKCTIIPKEDGYYDLYTFNYSGCTLSFYHSGSKSLISSHNTVVVKGNYGKEKEKPISIYFNNNEIKFDQPPIMEDGRTLVPVRAIFEKMGMDVNWDNNTSTVTASNGINEIKLKINDTTAYVDGKQYTLDVPAKVINDRTLVPVRFVAESIGAEVTWDEDSQSVGIYYPFAYLIINDKTIAIPYKNYATGKYVTVSNIAKAFGGFNDLYNESDKSRGILKLWSDSAGGSLKANYDLKNANDHTEQVFYMTLNDKAITNEQKYIIGTDKISMTKRENTAYVKLEDIVLFMPCRLFYSEQFDITVDYIIENFDFNDSFSPFVVSSDTLTFKDEKAQEEFFEHLETWGGTLIGAKKFKELFVNFDIGTIIGIDEQYWKAALDSYVEIDEELLQSSYNKVMLDLCQATQDANSLLEYMNEGMDLLAELDLLNSIESAKLWGKEDPRVMLESWHPDASGTRHNLNMLTSTGLDFLEELATVQVLYESYLYAEDSLNELLDCMDNHPENEPFVTYARNYMKRYEDKGTLISSALKNSVVKNVLGEVTDSIISTLFELSTDKITSETANKAIEGAFTGSDAKIQNLIANLVYEAVMQLPIVENSFTGAEEYFKFTVLRCMYSYAYTYRVEAMKDTSTANKRRILKNLIIAQVKTNLECKESMLTIFKTTSVKDKNNRFERLQDAIDVSNTFIGLCHSASIY